MATVHGQATRVAAPRVHERLGDLSEFIDFEPSSCVQAIGLTNQAMCHRVMQLRPGESSRARA